jgi:hypothetical protein
MTSLDGIRLDYFQIGVEYEVGTNTAALFLAEGWAEPVPLDAPAPIVPFSSNDPFDSRFLYAPKEPPPLPDPIKEFSGPRSHSVAADAPRKRRSRRRR